jgi:protein phosphatase PTC7
LENDNDLKRLNNLKFVMCPPSREVANFFDHSQFVPRQCQYLLLYKKKKKKTLTSLRMRRQRLLLNAGLGFFKRTTHWIPHPAKEVSGGEDAYLATNYALGVLDGVSWWGEKHKGIASAGLVSDMLAQAAYEVVYEEWMEDPQSGPHSAYKLLIDSYNRIQDDIRAGEAFLMDEIAQKQRDEGTSQEDIKPLKRPSPLVVGTSTALLASIESDGTLSIANIGDCTALVIRNGEMILATAHQHHDTTTPYQLGTASKDHPSAADKYALQLQPRDIVVIGSDGVFDNVYPKDIVSTINERTKEIVGAMNLAIDIDSLQMPNEHHPNRAEELHLRTVIELMNHRKISALTEDDRDILALHVASLQCLRQASLNSVDPRCDTPYASAIIEGGAYYEGGKLDDMTLIVAMVGLNDVLLGERTGKGSLVGVSIPHKNWP